MISFPTHWSKLIFPQSFAHRHNDLILFKLHLLEMGVTSILQGYGKNESLEHISKSLYSSDLSRGIHPKTPVDV